MLVVKLSFSFKLYSLRDTDYYYFFFIIIGLYLFIFLYFYNSLLIFASIYAYKTGSQAILT